MATDDEAKADKGGRRAGEQRARRLAGQVNRLLSGEACSSPDEADPGARTARELTDQAARDAAGEWRDKPDPCDEPGPGERDRPGADRPAQRQAPGGRVGDAGGTARPPRDDQTSR
ncbi:hypothetical protein Ga0074812_11697 [Parafrankia irregularis]|uniref:Uncharacterized protein n=1 Tax=Parafrankia irregularis TaxID=795642 RepID=A0A0S4QRF4_9ACTN|nr:hypothetical protein Ga0074812_11697 [Parafrankia irregularis]